MRYHPNSQSSVQASHGSRLGILWLVAALGVAAVTGVGPLLVKQASGSRDRLVRAYRTGQLRQADGVEEIIPRQLEPERDDVTDLILVRDVDERGAPHRATPPAANEALPRTSFALSPAGVPVFTPASRLPASRPPLPHRGRAPPRRAL